MTEVVKLHRKGAIGIVVMEERESRNTFSERFISGLLETFDEIRQDPELKVVVVQGYDNYFCCGGTKEELIGLLEQQGQFTDLQFHDLLLRCEIPVIAAMQGHAIGGGLAFGSFADIIVMGDGCIYSAAFMKYGFTPGMGATYIIPRKFGEVLGNEMLFSARTYYGNELRERGVGAKVVKKKDVIDAAMSIAEDLADKPALSLRLLKEQLTREVRTQLPDAIARELEMHKLSFAQPGVRERIDGLFGN